MKPALAVILGTVVAIAFSGCGNKKPEAQTAKPEVAASSSSGNPLTAPVDYLGAVGAAQKQAERFADLNPVQQAIRAFQAGEDRMPSNLKELVSEGYLPKLPTPPRGLVMAYNPGTGQVKFVPNGQPPSPPAAR